MSRREKDDRAGLSLAGSLLFLCCLLQAAMVSPGEPASPAEAKSETRENLPPFVYLRAQPEEGTAPLRVRFDATESFDGDGTITGYRWSYAGEPRQEAQDGGKLVLEFFKPGKYGVSVVAVDDAGGANLETVTITVKDPGSAGAGKNGPSRNILDAYGRPCGPDGEFIRSVYRCILDVDPTEAELAKWTGDIRNGFAREDLVRVLFDSKRYKARKTSDAEYVRDVYRAVLGRAPRPPELEYAVGRIEKGAGRYNVLNDIFHALYRKVKAQCPSKKETDRVPDGQVDDNPPCNLLCGCARDPDSVWPVNVHFYADGPAGQGRKIANITADLYGLFIPSPDKNHCFCLPVPEELKDGRPHKIFVYAIDNTGGESKLLLASPQTIQCETRRVETQGTPGSVAPLSQEEKTLFEVRKRLLDLLAEGKGDSPEAGNAYEEYKKAKEAYEKGR